MSVRLAWFCIAALAAGAADAAQPGSVVRAGIIGCDAHALPWTEIVNGPKASGEIAQMRIVAAFPGGSPDIPASMEILRNSVEPMKALGVEMVDSIDALLPKVDAVLVLSIDGRPHLEQARKVIAARKPLFIDKPMAGSLADAVRIVDLAREAKVPCFSSSSLRFAPGTVAIVEKKPCGSIRGCDAYSPAPLEPHHPDFFWYGIHGVETLFTLMGPGCKSVARASTEGSDVAVGVWGDGRLGVFRGIRDGARGYGATVFGEKSIVETGKFEGYEPLIVEIVRFFKTGKPPVAPEVTLEILAFMEAADQSKRKGGGPVTLESVFAAARSAK